MRAHEKINTKVKFDDIKFYDEIVQKRIPFIIMINGLEYEGVFIIQYSDATTDFWVEWVKEPPISDDALYELENQIYDLYLG